MRELLFFDLKADEVADPLYQYLECQEAPVVEGDPMFARPEDDT